MTPDQLAEIHAEAMTLPAPWSTEDFAGLLASPGTFLIPLSSWQKISGVSLPEARGSAPAIFRQKNYPPATTQSAQYIGFAIGRVVLDEAELLTLAVLPDHRRQGLGAAALLQFETKAKINGARIAHLEVAASNKAARALYAAHAWQETGTRRAYYRATPERVDAILMQKTLGKP